MSENEIGGGLLSPKNDPRETIGRLACHFAQNDERFVILCADVAVRIGLTSFKNEFPNHFVEAGIAEQNMIGMAAAMANEGYHVVAVAYAPFISARVMDQVKVFLGYMKSPVVLLGIGAGLVSGDLGATHTALEDVGLMRSIPNLDIMSPADNLEVKKCIEAALESRRPCYIRVCSNDLPDVYTKDYPLTIGKAIALKSGSDIALLATGPMVNIALQVADLLAEEKIQCKVLNYHTIKPFDNSVLEKCSDCKLLVSMEEHNIIGGLGSAAAEYLSSKRNIPPLLRLGVQDMYYYADTYSALKERAGLTPQAIKTSILKSLFH